VALKHRSLLPDDVRVTGIVDFSLAEVQNPLNTASTYLENRNFFIGDHLSNLDIIFASLLHLADRLKLIDLNSPKNHSLKIYLSNINKIQTAQAALNFKSL
jgi:glutathione S-transferase